MASAVALARRGVEVTLFEAFAAPHPIGSGLLLQPSGLAALRALGLEDAARAVGAPIARLDGRNLAGRRILDLDYQAWKPGSLGVGIHRASLFDVLFAAVGEAGIELVRGTRIEGVVDWTRPRLIDAAGLEHGPFDLAVIADGSGSKLRSIVRPSARAKVYPWGAVWADVVDADDAFAGALLQIYHRAEIMIGALPVGRGGAPAAPPRVSLFWSLPVNQMDAFFAQDFDAWRGQVATWRPDLAPLLAGLPGADAFSRALYRDVSVGRWNRGACVLIGDAAHGTSPQLGQGANLALLDAMELALAIERPVRSIGVTLERFPIPRDRRDALGFCFRALSSREPVSASLENALARFQRGRRRQTALYQLASRALTPMFQSSGRFWPWVRDWLFAPAARLPGARIIAGAVLSGVARLGRAPRHLRP
jgi:2-polyprenyl-6-methoxyphenol hydroxylase-like FAD-dependent oxidoreductase